MASCYMDPCGRHRLRGRARRSFLAVGLLTFVICLLPSSRAVHDETGGVEAGVLMDNARARGACMSGDDRVSGGITLSFSHPEGKNGKCRVRVVQSVANGPSFMFPMRRYGMECGQARTTPTICWRQAYHVSYDYDVLSLRDDDDNEADYGLMQPYNSCHATCKTIAEGTWEVELENIQNNPNKHCLVETTQQGCPVRGVLAYVDSKLLLKLKTKQAKQEAAAERENAKSEYVKAFERTGSSNTLLASLTYQDLRRLDEEQPQARREGIERWYALLPQPNSQLSIDEKHAALLEIVKANSQEHDCGTKAEKVPVDHMTKHEMELCMYKHGPSYYGEDVFWVIGVKLMDEEYLRTYLKSMAW